MRRRVSFRRAMQRELRGFAVRTLRGLGDMATGPAQQIHMYAANAGFTGADLVTAVAVALAESGGNPGIYNAEAQKGTPPGQGSYGLWQIYLWKHPEFAGWNLNDPQTNANAAFSVYSKAGGFSPWTTFRTGAYQRFLSLVVPPGQIDSTAPPPPLTIDAATGQPIEDSTPTPIAAGVAGPPGKIALLAIGAVVTYLAADFLFGDN